MLGHFLLTAWFICYQGITFDEGGYFAYALNWAKGHPQRLFPLEDSKTPMVAISLIPTALKPFLSPSFLQNDPYFYAYIGRPFMYLYQLVGCYAVFCWLYRLWGGTKWVIPLLFYCFDPIIFSYGMLIASDLPSTGLLVSSIYLAWRFTNTQQKKYWWMLCVAAATAVLVKQSMIYCYPLLAVLFLFKACGKKSFSPKKAATQVLQFALIQWAFICIIYYFNGLGTAFGDIHFQSAAFTKLQQNLHFLSGVPVPVPISFIQGIDWLQHNAEFGGCQPESTYPGVWLLGRHECHQGIWYYYMVTAVFKLPLLVWLAFFAALGRLLFNANLGKKLAANVFIWLPFVYFLLILSFLNKFQIGIRHAIPLLPFLYIGVSGIFVWFFEKKRWLFATLGLLHFIGVIRFWPNLMAYTNELVWNKTNAYNLIRDSSIDYGQSAPTLKRFLSSHPDYKMPATLPAAGRFAITIQDLTTENLGKDGRNYGWLLNNFKPVGNYQYSILLFDIDEAGLQAAGLK
jgi:hypothetical protein